MLQKRFVRAAMTAITILIVALLGGINIANIIYMQNSTSKLLQTMTETLEFAPFEVMGYGFVGDREYHFSVEVHEETSDDSNPVFGRIPRRRSREDEMKSALYFIVETDGQGTILNIDVSEIPSLSEEDAEQLALKAISFNASTGSIGHFQFNSRTTFNGENVIYLFMDVTAEHFQAFQAALISIAGGIVCWLIMYLVVRRLSYRTIRPVAEGIEKQKQFITNAGHEIKTPLAIILSNLDAMELTGGGNKYSTRIREQVRRLGDLTQNLLTLSKIDESSLVLQKEELNLSEMADEIAKMFEEVFFSRSVTYSQNIEPNISYAGDRQQMARLMSILLDNASKYATLGGTAQLELKKEGKHILLQLTNSCENTEGDANLLFDRFHRGDSARTQSAGGFGIGLSTAKAIVEAHKGSIEAKYGEGDIRFTIQL